MLHGQEQPLFKCFFCKEHNLATYENFQAENRISQQTGILDFNLRTSIQRNNK